MHELIIGDSIAIQSSSIDIAQEITQQMDSIIPHRKILLKSVDQMDSHSINQGFIFHYPSEAEKNYQKTIPILDYNKKKVYSDIKSSYSKNLVNKLKKTDVNNLFITLKREMTYLIDQVDVLLKIAKEESESKAKELIQKQIMQLPNKDVFNIIRELTVKFNPIISKLIVSKADFSLQSVFG